MNVQEIKDAVDLGKSVHWANRGYTIVRDSRGQYLIRYAQNGHCIGLTHEDGTTLNGKEEDFFIVDTPPIRVTSEEKAGATKGTIIKDGKPYLDGDPSSICVIWNNLIGDNHTGTGYENWRRQNEVTNGEYTLTFEGSITKRYFRLTDEA